MIGDIPRKAWEWLHSLEAEDSQRSTAASDPTAYWLIAIYLRHCETEVEAARMTGEYLTNIRSRLKLFCQYPGLRDRKASRITVDDLQAFFDWMRGERFTPHYVASVGQAVRAVWRWGARPVAGRTPTRILSTNPLDGFAFPKSSPCVRGYVGGDVVRRFLRYCWSRARQTTRIRSRHYKLFVLMLWFQRLTGCRPGEACGLRWDQWDRERGQIILTEHKTAKKTNRTRVIHVTRPVARLLKTIERLPQRNAEYVFTHERHTMAGGDNIAAQLAGEPWRSGSAAAGRVRTWRRDAIALAAALAKEGKSTGGLEKIEDVGPRKFVAYLNRHAYISEAVGKGMTLESVASLVGNAPTMSGQTYTHAIEQLDAARAESLVRRGQK